MKFLTVLAVVMALAVSTAQGQSCYSMSYGQTAAYAQPFQLSAVVPGQTQTITVPVTISISTPAVALANPEPPLAMVAAPARPAPVAYAAPLAVPTCGAVAYGTSFGLASNFGYSAGFARTANVGFANRLAVVNASNFGVARTAATQVAGRGVAITAVDRKGTTVSAVGNTNARIKRNLFGRIKGARVDSNRGLLGRINPF